MIKTDNFKDYRLIDAGDKAKLESWNGIILDRPDPMALWPKQKTAEWKKAKAVYHRSSKGGGNWEFKQKLPEFWTISYRDLKFIQVSVFLGPFVNGFGRINMHYFGSSA